MNITTGGLVKWKNAEPAEYFTIAILCNDSIVYSTNISSKKGENYVEIKNLKPKDGKLKLTFRIQSNTNKSAESWKKASIVTFKFVKITNMAKR